MRTQTHNVNASALTKDQQVPYSLRSATSPVTATPQLRCMRSARHRPEGTPRRPETTVRPDARTATIESQTKRTRDGTVALGHLRPPLTLRIHAPRPRSSAQMRRAQARNGSYEQLQPRCCRRRCNALHLSPYTGVRLAWPRLVRTHARGCGECAQGSSHFAKEQPSSVSFLKALPKSSASLPSSSA